MAIGARSRATAHKLWALLPAVYRHCAIGYTDFWQAYAGILPSRRHRAVGQERGQSSHIEPRATPCASAVAGWFARHSRSRKRLPIRLAPFGTTSTIIT